MLLVRSSSIRTLLVLLVLLLLVPGRRSVLDLAGGGVLLLADGTVLDLAAIRVELIGCVVLHVGVVGHVRCVERDLGGILGNNWREVNSAEVGGTAACAWEAGLVVVVDADEGPVLGVADKGGFKHGCETRGTGAVGDHPASVVQEVCTLA